MISPLYMAHRALKLNVYAAPFPAHGTRHLLFVWYFLIAAPIPFPWRRDIVSYPGTAGRKRVCWHMSGSSRGLHSIDVPYAMLFCVLLWYRAKKEVMRLYKIEWVQRRTNRSNMHSVAGRSRLHDLLYNKEISISRSMVCLTVLLL